MKKTTEKEEEVEHKEDVRTAKEKTEEYKANQMKVHHSILEKLKKEEEDINIDPQIDEMRAKWAKRETEELKKLDKLLKKERNDFENVE